MGHDADATFTGRQVAWLGPPQHGIARSYWDTPAAGLRPPGPQDQTHLATGELGIVGERVTTSPVGHWYVLRFAGGHELETVLPAPDLVQLDPPAKPLGDALGQAHGRYGPVHAKGLRAAVSRLLRVRGA